MTIDFFRQLSARFKHWNHRRATIQALSGLSDWQLRDIGLTRAEIPAIVEAAFAAEQQAHALDRPPAPRVRLRPQTPASGGPAVAA